MLFKLFQKRPQGYADLTPAEVHARLHSGKRVALIDVRSAHEYAAGHLPKAELIPLGELAARHTEIDSGGDIIVYCRGSARSRRAAALLAKLGYTNVYNMTGGIVAWPYGVKR